MPQLDFATFPTQIFWLCITFLLLYLVMWKVVIPRISGVLEERQSRVENDLERAEQLQLEAKAPNASVRNRSRKLTLTMRNRWKATS